MEFKTIEEVINEPRKRTLYICPKCDETSVLKDGIEDHYGRAHVVKERAEVGDHQLVYLEDKEEALLFAGRRTKYLRWEGSGWYYNRQVEPYDDNDSYTCWTPISHLESDLREQLQNLGWNYRELRNFIRRGGG